MTRLWEIVTNRINLKNDTAYDFRNIDIKFQRNIPTDKDKDIERAVKARTAGIASLETAITMSGVEVDAEAEAARIRADKSDEQITDLHTAGLADVLTATEYIFGEEKGKIVADRLTMENTGYDVPLEGEDNG
jgi:hypothetical protein